MTIDRWRGLGELLLDAVEHGSTAVERVQIETARRPFALLERIAAVAAPARGIHAVHDAAVSGVHAAIRGVTRLARATLVVALRDAAKGGSGAATAAP